MKPRLFALLLAAIAVALALWGETTPAAAKLRALVAPDADPSRPVIVAVVETSAAPTPLDAALILRAVQRFQPRGVTFFDPLTGDDGRPLLEAKLAEIAAPVQFAAPSREITAPGRGRDPTERWTQRVTFDRLMVRAERRERGEIAADLDNLFRDRWIAVETADGRGAAKLAAAWNPSTPPTYFPGAAAFAIALAASLPWWIKGRRHRFIVALVLAIAWVGGAFALGRYEHVAIPLLGMLALPLLALIPPPLDEVQQRKLPA